LDKYVTVSIPAALAEAIDELNGELGYWPSRGAFVREAILEKLRDERRRLREMREAKSDG
jgi:Arc/MetJ-type ribon-helix-helix transcriptional regulator